MGKAIDIVIDLETLGTKPGCVILEIGACAIDPDTGAFLANFSRRLDELFTNYKYPLLEDEEKTLAWWLENNPTTYYRLVHRIHDYAPRPPEDDLKAFKAWFDSQTSGRDPKRVRIWANGPSFDIAILQAAYDRYGVERPWICWQERCVRTALEAADYQSGSVSWIERGPRHRALNDARHEARKLFYSGALGTTSRVMRRLRERGTIDAGEVVNAAHG